MKIWEVKTNKFIDKFKYLFLRRWNTRRNQAFIDGVHNDVGRALRLEGEHFFETFYHSAIIRLPNSTIMGRVELEQDITTRIRPSRELEEEGREQIAEFLLVDVPKIEIKIGNQGPPSIMRGHNILND